MASSSGKTIRYQVAIVSDGNWVYLYRKPATQTTAASNQFSTIKTGSLVIATKISPDQKYYYLPSQDAWVAATSVNIVSTSPSPNVSDTEVRRVTNMRNDSTDVDARLNAPNNDTYTRPDYVSAEKFDYVRVNQDNTVTSSGSVNGPSSVYNKKAKADVEVDTSNGGANFRNISNNLYVNGIFGIPYQFMPTVDRRTNNATGTAYGLGKKYVDKVIARNNLLFLTPGIQEFMKGANNDDKAKVIQALIDHASSSVLESVQKYSRYYSMKFSFSDYYKYVDRMCAATATLMGIGDVSIENLPGRRLDNIEWERVRDNSEFKKLFFSNSAVVYYVDGLNSVSESFSSDTRESSLASSVNGLSDEAKELNFITKKQLGEGGAGDLADMTGSGLEGLVEGMLNGRGVLSGILGNTTTLLNGGKIVFPEMWSDSNFDRSYSINIKLRSPEADPVSIFLNIIVPYIHLIALTAPRDYSRKDESNGYIEPFLVRATFSGMFNIDMGLITDLSSDKGSEGTWSMDGLPTQLDISLTIKDLYKSLYISEDAARLAGNDGLMDFLMTTSGVALNEPRVSRHVAAYMASQKKAIFGFPSMIGTQIRDSLTNVLDHVFKI